MYRHSALLLELAFVTELIDDRCIQYRKAKWRKASFEADVWTTIFGLTIDFNVKLENGDLLTSAKHRVLLDSIKTWLCVQSHGDSSRGKLLASKSIYARLIKTLHMIDYLLLNASRFSLSQFGLQNITANDIAELAQRIANTNSVVIGVYQWPDRLAAFLRTKIGGTEQAELRNVLRQNPKLNSVLPEHGDRLLNLTDDEILLARAWLWKSGFYSRTLYSWQPRPRTGLLAKLIYPDTLLGKSSKPVPSELCINSEASTRREYPIVSDTDDDDERSSELIFSEYLAVLRRMGNLAHVGLPVPEFALLSLDNASFTSLLDLKSPGRFLTVPREVLFSALRSSIEFSLDYGEDLVSSFLKIVAEAKLSGLDCQTYAFSKGIDTHLTDKLRSLGVKEWTIDSNQRRASDSPCSSATHHGVFIRLRRSEGLWELLRVLYGSIQVCIGILVARRQGELLELIAGRSLDKIGAYLIFLNRKSGIGEMREKEARPIPPIVVRLIGLIERLQDGLIALGVLNKNGPLFAFPRYSGMGLIQMTDSRYNESLDYFCDYFETPLTLSGERYYLRQHQLRRFFAMLFFWGRAFGGMDTLRWFLGHTDIRHLYNYITESVPGATLRSIKATYAVEQLTAQEKNAEMLADLLEHHFGTRNFSILDSEELNEYIEDLLAEGVVKIEPVFFDGPNGQSYRILIVVTQKAVPT